MWQAFERRRASRYGAGVDAVQVNVRLMPAMLAKLDRLRGSMSRPEYLRSLLARGERERPLMTDDDAARNPWEPGDGTRWLYVAATDDWTGWVPGEDGCWVRSREWMDEHYPDHPDVGRVD